MLKKWWVFSSQDIAFKGNHIIWSNNIIVYSIIKLSTNPWNSCSCAYLIVAKVRRTKLKFQWLLSKIYNKNCTKWFYISKWLSITFSENFLLKENLFFSMKYQQFKKDVSIEKPCMITHCEVGGHGGITLELCYNSGHISNPFSPLFYPQRSEFLTPFYTMWPRIDNQNILKPQGNDAYPLSQCSKRV